MMKLIALALITGYLWGYLDSRLVWKRVADFYAYRLARLGD